MRESFQTILTNYCQRTKCKASLQEFIREFTSFQRTLPIYSTILQAIFSKLWSENSLFHVTLHTKTKTLGLIVNNYNEL